jgi:hypothetical protein
MNWIGDNTPTIEYSLRYSSDAEYRTSELSKGVVDEILKMEFVALAFGHIRGELEYNHIIFPTKNLTDLLRLVQRNCI